MAEGAPCYPARVRILTRYLVARFLGFFAAFLIVSLLTIAVVEMMLNLGDMLRADAGLPGVATYLLLRLPAYYLRDLVPIVAFASAFFTLGTAARWLELLAAKAGGISTQRLSLPMLGAALLLTALTFGVKRFKNQGRFTCAAKSGDYRQLTNRQIQIETFEIILANAA